MASFFFLQLQIKSENRGDLQISADPICLLDAFEKMATDQDLSSEAPLCVWTDTCLIHSEMQGLIGVCMCMCVGGDEWQGQLIYKNALTAVCIQNKMEKKMQLNETPSERMKGRPECQIGCLQCRTLIRNASAGQRQQIHSPPGSILAVPVINFLCRLAQLVL